MASPLRSMQQAASVDSQSLEAWELMREVNPEDPLEAAKAYKRVMAALRWFIENDETNLGDPMNEYWEANYRRAKKVYKAASGIQLRPEDDDPNYFRFVSNL